MDRDATIGLIAGLSIGVVLAVAITCITILCIRAWERNQDRRNWSERSTANLQTHAEGAVSISTTSVSSSGATDKDGCFSIWFGMRRNFSSINPGIARFSYRQIKNCTQNFTSLLGEGAFGPVYKGVESGNVFAVKVLATNSKQGDREFETEVMLLGRLHHRNLVNLVGYCVGGGHRILVYEYMCNGSLAAKLYGEETLPWELRMNIAQDVAKGIEYLHEGAIPPVIHRDIKSANILLDASMTARVADFGLSREATHKEEGKGIKGTIGYVDPAYLATNNYTEKSDVYGFGVLLFELITGRSPQQGLMDHVQTATVLADGMQGWEMLLDPRLDGKCNMEEFACMAYVASKCVAALPANRPRIRNVALSLLKISKAVTHGRLTEEGLSYLLENDREGPMVEWSGPIREVRE